jgi:hypothetical protein
VTEFGPEVESELERWSIRDAEPDWDDVISRAQRKRRAAGSRPRRLYLVSAAFAAVALAAPAFALVANHLFGGRPVLGTLSEVGVKLGSGRAAVIFFRSHGSAVVRDKEGFHYREPRSDSSRAFRWRLDLTGLQRVEVVTITVDDGPRVSLCTGCHAGSGGQFVLRSAAALALLDGDATVTVNARSSRVMPAMGGRLFLHSAPPSIER